MKVLTAIISILLIVTSVALAEDPADTLLDAKLALASLKERYSEKHPKVIEAEMKLESLSKIKVSAKDYIEHIQKRLDRLKAEDALSAQKYLPKHPIRLRGSTELSLLTQELKTAEQDAAANP